MAACREYEDDPEPWKGTEHTVGLQKAELLWEGYRRRGSEVVVGPGIPSQLVSNFISEEWGYSSGTLLMKRLLKMKGVLMLLRLPLEKVIW